MENDFVKECIREERINFTFHVLEMKVLRYFICFLILNIYILISLNFSFFCCSMSVVVSLGEASVIFSDADFVYIDDACKPWWMSRILYNLGFREMWGNKYIVFTRFSKKRQKFNIIWNNLSKKWSIVMQMCMYMIVFHSILSWLF